MIAQIKTAFAAASIVKKAIMSAIFALVAFIIINFAHDILFGAKKTELKLQKNTTRAAIESGKDASETTSRVARDEDVIDSKAKKVINDVKEADNFRDAHSAGASGLCAHHNICAEDEMQ